MVLLPHQEVVKSLNSPDFSYSNQFFAYHILSERTQQI